MTDNENLLQNIANEIKRECTMKSVSVDIEWVSYFIELMLLNPNYGKLFMKTLKRTTLEYFVNSCVTALTKQQDPHIITLRMQHLYFNHGSSTSQLREHEESRMIRLHPLLSEICDSPPAEGMESLDKLMRKISIYVILETGLGNPGNIVVLREGLAALESVISRNALVDGVRIELLQEVAPVVAGVRLFNRDCGKGGDAIPDLPYNLSDAGHACSFTLNNSLHKVMDKVNQLTTSIEEDLKIDEQTGNVTFLIRPDTSLNPGDYEHAFAVLLAYRQYEKYIRRLIVDNEGIVAKSRELIKGTKDILEEMHAFMKGRTAVPAEQIFPYFTRLWESWRGMQDCMFLTSTLSTLLGSLDALYESVPPTAAELARGERGVLTDQQRMANAADPELRKKLLTRTDYVSPENLINTDIQFEYLGFCGTSICVGALLPGARNIGAIRVGSRYFLFSHAEYALRFAKDPDRYILEVLQYARTHPAFINFLGIYDDVYRFKDVDELVKKTELKSISDEKMVQTELHPVPENIVRGYSWNLWDHKREACLWSDVVNRRTRSTQAGFAIGRSSLGCQATEPRNAAAQTMRDKAV